MSDSITCCFRGLFLLLVVTVCTVATDAVAGNGLTFELIPPEQIEELEEERGVIEDGKLVVRRVHLKGKRLLFPERDITRPYLQEVVVNEYIQRGPLLSVSEIHNLAYALTRAYRDKGLAFVEVYVTPQEVVAGEVVLRVLVGNLSEVRVLGASHYTAEQLIEPFESQFSVPVYVPEVERGIDRINRLPGLEVYGVFSAGRERGETRLNLRVTEEKARQTRVVLDNHGLEETGRHRLQVQHQENNLWGMGETLRVTATATEQSGTLMGSFDYSRPLAYSQRWGLGVSRSQFEVDGQFAALGLSGELDTVSGHWSMEPETDAPTRWYTALAYKRARVDSDSFPGLLGQTSDYVTALLRFDKGFQTQLPHLVQYFDVTPLVGQTVETENTNLDGAFFTLKTGYSLRYDWQGASLYPSRFILKGQYSPDPLPSSERINLTGAGAVRGYEPGRFNAETALRATFEQQLYEFRWGGGWQVRPMIFTDVARGWQENAGNSQARFWGGGAGLDLSYGESLQADINWAIPIDQKSPTMNRPENNSLIHGSLSFSF
ncbi:ShlB/FhaC/HecB family hemolysin secretion/activation protein [Halovibrio salipaludis]|uniref:ShlB/FhaC/HecB family hemolysin secretion/activation protein n=1 Tax=Halovibrio salipaludis TaxID=2032626 RepID=UPI00130410B4|nr:ShlB/FhaC/HecB family hemolysin secretion/activation protein [Halovibrio salipaludis]